MFTLVGYLNDLSAVSIAAQGAYTALADPHITTWLTDIFVPKWNKLMGVYAVGTTMVDLRLESPSLRRLTYERISPVENAVNFPSDHNPDGFLYDRFERPRELVVSEHLQAHTPTGEAFAGADISFIGVALGDGITPIPSGPIFSVHATCLAGGTKWLWSNTTLTLTEDIPAGRYAVVGMKFMEATALAARLVFQEGGPRPGCIGTIDEQSPDCSRFRAGKAGLWGEFEHDALPTIDTLSDLAGAAGTVILDLIQIRAGR